MSRLSSLISWSINWSIESSPSVSGDSLSSRIEESGDDKEDEAGVELDDLGSTCRGLCRALDSFAFSGDGERGICAFLWLCASDLTCAVLAMGCSGFEISRSLEFGICRSDGFGFGAWVSFGIGLITSSSASLSSEMWYRAGVQIFFIGGGFLVDFGNVELLALFVSNFEDLGGGADRIYNESGGDDIGEVSDNSVVCLPAVDLIELALKLKTIVLREGLLCPLVIASSSWKSSSTLESKDKSNAITTVKRKRAIDGDEKESLKAPADDMFQETLEKK